VRYRVGDAQGVHGSATGSGASYSANLSGLLKGENFVTYFAVNQATAASALAAGVGDVPLIGMPEVMPIYVIACRLDINDDGARTPEIDGVLILRYLIGIRGEALLAGLPSPLPGIRTTATEIESFLAAQNYNVQGGAAANATATRDGLVLLRFMRNVNTVAMIAGTDIPAGDFTAVRNRIIGWCA
jgi:hypothetical protein